MGHMRFLFCSWLLGCSCPHLFLLLAGLPPGQSTYHCYLLRAAMIRCAHAQLLLLLPVDSSPASRPATVATEAACRRHVRKGAVHTLDKTCLPLPRRQRQAAWLELNQLGSTQREASA